MSATEKAPHWALPPEIVADIRAYIAECRANGGPPGWSPPAGSGRTTSPGDPPEVVRERGDRRCPECGDVKFVPGPAGVFQRKCWSHGHLWVPAEAMNRLVFRLGRPPITVGEALKLPVERVHYAPHPAARPCPKCGEVAFFAGPRGLPERRCWGCEHIFTVEMPDEAETA